MTTSLGSDYNISGLENGIRCTLQFSFVNVICSPVSTYVHTEALGVFLFTGFKGASDDKPLCGYFENLRT
jgi:hypothetical protein